jgi:metal-dependent hydrolase (beta-lactamase superfamily II)
MCGGTKMLSVTMFPAKNGDCFLISFGEDSIKHILIDCGYAETYRRYLRKHLLSLAEKDEYISLMVITHVDQDHILGAIPFLKENNAKKLIHISEIWHNSYRHLQFSKEKIDIVGELERRALEEQIAVGNSIIKESGDTVVDSEISVKQGSTLASLIYEGNYNWNQSFEGKAVSTSVKQFVEIGDARLWILSPDKNKLDSLSRDWLMHLQSYKYNFNLSEEQIFDDAFEFYMMGKPELNIIDESISRAAINNLDHFLDMKQCDIDTAVLNGSSIAFYVEYAGKKILFLADSHPDIICSNLAELDKLGLLEGGFDLVKIPHHGSAKNMIPELAQLIPSQKYLISTNGKTHNHPDLEALARILLAGQEGKSKELIFNYPTETAIMMENKEWKTKYNYSVYIADGDTPIIVEL